MFFWRIWRYAHLCTKSTEVNLYGFQCASGITLCVYGVVLEKCKRAFTFLRATGISSIYPSVLAKYE